MSAGPGILQIEMQGDTLILTPSADLRELDYPRIEAEMADALRRVKDGSATHVVFDFHKTDYYGSTALAYFVKLWKAVRHRGGQFAFANISDHEREILRLTKLDALWHICSSREEALQAVRG